MINTNGISIDYTRLESAASAVESWEQQIGIIDPMTEVKASPFIEQVSREDKIVKWLTMK